MAKKGGKCGCFHIVSALWGALLLTVLIWNLLSSTTLNDHSHRDAELPAQSSQPGGDAKPVDLLQSSDRPTQRPALRRSVQENPKPPRQCRAGVPWHTTPLEDNSERPAASPEEYEIASDIWTVLPGTDLTHQHGKLGLWPNGTCCRLMPVALPSGGLTHDERRDAHRGFCFNSRVSESLDVDRIQEDVRSAGCKAKHEQYPCNLPIASVVIVFHNEHFNTLIRSVHSVLNHAPADLLKEIVLVDDVSTPDELRFYKRHWDRLQDELSGYIRVLPKIRLVRLKKRRGLMLARMEGAWRATGEILVFLDSHIECTTGFLEPLLARIMDDRKRVVVPSIDGINNERFEYALGGLGVLSFTWTLGQDAMGRPDNDEAANSSVMAGGLFAGDRQYFLYLGGYDPEMKLYGGEEMEIGFRTWQCGGAIEHLPCSHVGHIFRTGDYWQGQVYKVPMEEITRNKLRAAEVWMDEYKELVHRFSARLPYGMSVEPLGPRRALREKLKCKSFKWFLENVAHEVRLPRDASTRSGSLMNLMTGGCIDTLGDEKDGAAPGAYPCHGQHGTQAVTMDTDGHLHIAGGRFCIALRNGQLVAASCADKSQRWRLEPAPGALTGMFKVRNGDTCFEAQHQQTAKSPFTLSARHCDNNGNQLWGWYK